MLPKIERKLKAFFRKIPGVVSVFIFGSQAKNRTTPFSDVDIAVLFEHGRAPDFRSQIDLKEELCSLLQSEVDLVILNRANPLLKHQVLKNGKRILLNSSEIFDDFFARSLVEYADLKRLRAPIERSILKGRSYGG